MPPCWRVASVAAVAIATLAAPCAAQQQAAGNSTWCPAGFGFDAAAAACTRCAAGTRSGAGAVGCDSCAIDGSQGGCVCPSAVGAGGLGCPPGQDASTGACAKCPEGKQSSGGTTPCSYCRFTLRPTREQDGCECGSLMFNMWNSSREDPDQGCTPCSAVQVRSVDGSTSNCHTTSLLRKCAKGEISPDCDATSAQCECSGGPKGEASLCAREGYYIPPRFDAQEQSLRIPGPDAAMPATEAEQIATIKLLQCVSLRPGKPSRCQHWSRCEPTFLDYLGDAELDQASGDREKEEIIDSKFTEWLNTSAGRSTRCPVRPPPVLAPSRVLPRSASLTAVAVRRSTPRIAAPRASAGLSATFACRTRTATALSIRTAGGLTSPR